MRLRISPDRLLKAIGAEQFSLLPLKGRLKKSRRVSENMAKTYTFQGHREVQGVPITIENRVGSVRSGIDDDGNQWRTRMKHDYGFIRRTEGADGEEVDVFLGPEPDAPVAYVVHQDKPDGSYDECKVMLGFASESDALAAYFANYDRRDLFGHVQAITVDALKKQWRFRIPAAEPVELAKDAGAEDRVRGDPCAWLAAALHSGHPPERRALYALMAKSAGVASAIHPGVGWVVTDATIDLAGTALFGERWEVVRQHWGLPTAGVVRRLLVSPPPDPVTMFGKAQRAEALAWAAETLPDPSERERAFADLESAVTALA